MSYLQDVLDRAMLLNLSDCFLDSDKCLYINDTGKLYFYLDSYIAYTHDSYVEVPEGVDYVFMLGRRDYYDGLNCTIVFPESLVAVARSSLIDYKINFRMLDILQVYDLSGLVLDFRKCKKLCCVTKESFYNLKIKELYLNESVKTLLYCAFSSAVMERLEAPGVEHVGGDTFHDSAIRELRLGKLKKFYHDSFVHMQNRVEELVISADMCVKMEKDLPLADRIYMPYNLNSCKSIIRESLNNILDRLDATSVIDTIDALHDVEDKLKQNDAYLTSIMGYLLDDIQVYISGARDTVHVNRANVGKRIIRDCRQFYIDDLTLSDCSMYLYKGTGTDTDVHKREYTCLGTESGLTVYLEE